MIFNSMPLAAWERGNVELGTLQITCNLLYNAPLFDVYSQQWDESAGKLAVVKQSLSSAGSIPVPLNSPIAIAIFPRSGTIITNVSCSGDAFTCSFLPNYAFSIIEINKDAVVSVRSVNT